jgi:hypothetical protein
LLDVYAYPVDKELCQEYLNEKPGNSPWGQQPILPRRQES